MSRFDSPLNNIHIASPCPADWNEMYGDDRKRFCGECKLNVYNLSGMTRDEAEALIMNAEGRLCVRFYRRADGSVITQDCPVGWVKVKQRARLVLTAAASLVMALFTGVFFVSLFSKQKATVGELRIPFTTPTPMHTMGAIAAPPRNTNTNAVQGEPSVIQGNFAVPSKKADDPKTNFEVGKMRVMSGQDQKRRS